jgi:hypothetical protein
MAFQALADPTKPSLSDYTIFLRNEGIRTDFLPDNSPFIPATYNAALEIVSLDIALVAALSYTMAVYNLGVDQLINYAQDITNETFFRDLREKYGIYSFVPGVVASASDQGTSSGLLNVEVMRRLTMADLQTLKTHYGRAYMSIAQQYGDNAWVLV